MSIFTVLDKHAPQYVKDLFTAVVNLSSLMARARRRRSLLGPTRFLIWSVVLFAIGFGLLLQLTPYDIARVVVATTLMAICTVIMIIVLSTFSLSLVGGKLRSLEFFRIYAYIAGTMLVFWIPMTGLVMAGTYWLLELTPSTSECWSQALWIEGLVALFIIEWWSYPARDWFRQAQVLSRWRCRLGLTLYFVVGVPIIVLLNYVIYYGLVRIAGFVKW